MELHAWFNVFSIGNEATDISESAEPLHVRFTHPEWVDTVFVDDGADRYWLNPGRPETREWVIENILEIVEKYDVDPIQDHTHESMDFAWMLNDWMVHREGRHVYAGLGTYIEEVQDELPRQIDTTRAIGAQGHAHFRQAFLREQDLDGRYDTPALVPPIPWIGDEPPPAPVELAAERDQGSEEQASAHRKVHLTWDKPAIGRDPDPFLRFAIYRVPHGSYSDISGVISDPRNLVYVTGQTEYLDHIPSSGHEEFDYLVTSLTRNHIEGDPAMASVTVTSADEEPEVVQEISRKMTLVH